MTLDLQLKLDAPDSLAGAIPETLEAFPPPDDYPMIVAPDGTVVSRYRDSIWNYSHLAGQFCTINFGDGPKVRATRRLSAENADLLRKLVAYYHYGDRPMVKPATIVKHVMSLMPIFRLCERNGIPVSSLSRYPRIMERLPGVLKSRQGYAIALLHEIYNARDVLGYFILDVAALKRFASDMQTLTTRQTAYIPARLWAYQVGRLREMIDDYLAHREAIEAMMQYCIDAFARNYGSLEAALDPGRNPWRSPLWTSCARLRNATYIGSFAQVAKEFGVADLIERWVLPPGRRLGAHDNDGAVYFARYLSAVSFVGAVYLANFSGMRRAEVGSLRANCLRIDEDERFGQIYLIQGETSKTVDDDHALWITSPTSRVAVDAMVSVARMRIRLAAANPRVPTTSEDVENPCLNTRAYEPWGQMRPGEERAPLSVRKVIRYYSWKVVCPRLFDLQAIAITPEDLAIARLVTPSLDEERFSVGESWPFSMHQLRRTLVVNATHSGMVSESSIQYEMKHQSRGMSLYYGQGYSRLPVNEKIQKEFVSAMYEALADTASRMLGEDFVSPLGGSHKRNLVQFISSKSRSELVKMAKKGELAIRETLLGICLNRDYCEYGGVDHIVECIKCDKALLDRGKRQLVASAFEIVDEQLERMRSEEQDHVALVAQKHALREALHVTIVD